MVHCRVVYIILLHYDYKYINVFISLILQLEEVELNFFYHICCLVA